MKSWKTVVSTLILLPIIVWCFQNCAPDHFAAHGNGTPYEGISVGDPNPDIPNEGGTTPPQTEPNSETGQKPPPETIATVHSTCRFDNSSYFESLTFGESTRGDDLVSLRLLSGDLVTHSISQGRQQVAVNQSSDNGLLIEMIIYGTDSSSVSYSVNGDASQTELAPCQNQ